MSETPQNDAGAEELIEAHVVVQSILSELTDNKDGYLALPDDRVAHWAEALPKVDEGERDEVLTHLIATVLKFDRIGEEAHAAADQFQDLAVGLADAMGKEAHLKRPARFEDDDEGRGAADKLIGASTTLRAPKLGEKKPNSGFVIPRKLR